MQPGPDYSSGADNSSAGPVTPEVVDVPMLLPEGSDDGTEQVARPTKLIRIAAMVRALLDEARRAPLDDAGRRSLKEIHERSIHELQEILSPDLCQELSDVTLPFSSDTPSESELRIAQAQLVGWLEGLFHGIQATLFTQQVQAQRQFEDMRGRRSLDAGTGAGERIPGAYL
jgi:Bacterial proteasome activator